MRTGGFDMRGSVEGGAVAVAPRDVVASSSSPSKNSASSALDVMRYQQRITPDCLPLANGSGSGSSASRKLPMPAPRSSTDVHDAPAADNSSRLASYLATASLEQHKPRARAPHFPFPPASSSSAAGGVVIRSPAREHVHQPSDFVNHTAPNPNVAGGSAAPDVSVRLQWGHNKRSRGRRDAPLPPAPTPAQETPAQARRRASIKIQRRNAAAASASASASASADKLLMPPPSARGGPVIRVASSLPPRAAAAAAAADALYGRTLQHHRSAEEQQPRAGAVAVAEHQPHPSAAAAAKQPQQQQRPQRAAASDKEKGKAPAVPEHPPPKKHQQAAAEVQKLVAAARPELPRIQTTLSRREKEEDFLAMKGTKLPQRPKKRTKAVEKAVSQIYPGQWLSEVSRTRYMVREKRSKKKRGGGLKAMDSDSD